MVGERLKSHKCWAVSPTNGRQTFKSTVVAVFVNCVCHNLRFTEECSHFDDVPYPIRLEVTDDKVARD